MQITLNRIPFDVRPVDDARRRAILADPVVRPGIVRPVWLRQADGGERRLAEGPAEAALPLPAGLIAWVPKAGPAGETPAKADGPSARMAERFLSAVGAKGFPEVMRAMARVTGMPGARLPREAFAACEGKGAYTILLHTDLAVVELENAGRNLSVHLLLPSLAAFSHLWGGPGDAAAESPADGPAAGSIRPGFLVPPPSEAASGLRRLALARRIEELQAQMAGVTAADLPADDPRRALLGRLAAEWRLLQPKGTRAA